MKFEQIKTQIHQTLSNPPIGQEVVIRACNILSRELLNGVHDRLIAGGFSQSDHKDTMRQKVEEAAWILSKEYLEAKVKLELGETDRSRQDSEQIKRMPLGVLFHIGAGNMDALPAFSVIEGMLAGNINILKLPEADLVLSKALLRRLTEIEPALKPYVYVFHISSVDKNRMKQLASLADAIVIWGGDEAVGAVRQLAAPSCRIIEWGHKISFAYVTMQGSASPNCLRWLAGHMLDTGQILCSSCQGIYLDTDDSSVTEQFCIGFSKILEEEAQKRQKKEMGFRARNTLRVHNSRLEASAYREKKVFSQGVTSVTWEKNPYLETSLMNGNCWVKNLKQDVMLRILREHCGYLQTTVLICDREEWEPISNLLYRAGVMHIRHAERQDFYRSPLPHDGEYPLRRYSKYVSSSM